MIHYFDFNLIIVMYIDFLSVISLAVLISKYNTLKYLPNINFLLLVSVAHPTDPHTDWIRTRHPEGAIDIVMCT